MRPRRDMLSTTFGVPLRAPLEPAMNVATSTTVAPERFDLGDLLKLVDKLIVNPVLIGDLHGFPIYADGTLPAGEIVAVDPATGREMWRASISHPLMANSKMADAARRALGISEGIPPTSQI